MSVLAFAVSAIVLAAVGAFCWCIGFTAGVRRLLDVLAGTALEGRVAAVDEAAPQRRRQLVV